MSEQFVIEPFVIKDMNVYIMLNIIDFIAINYYKCAIWHENSHLNMHAASIIHINIILILFGVLFAPFQSIFDGK